MSAADFRYGLATADAHEEFNASLYREIEELRGWGELPPGAKFWDVADVILDAFFGSTSIAEIDASELPSIVTDALMQIRDDS